MIKAVQKPFFSIIIPVYNVENFLEECLDSVLKQSFNNYEVIMVDDGSTDSSGEICDKYAEQDDRFYVCHKKNEGLLATRIYGIEKAEGDFIISLDSDDMLREDALEIIENMITALKADTVLFNASREKDFATAWNKLDFQEKKILEKEALYTLVCKGPYLNNMVLKCFKRGYSVSKDKIEKYFYVKNGEDLLQSLEIITNAKRVVYIDENLYFYRRNEKSITNIFQKSFYKSASTVGKVLTEYAKRWDGEEEKWLPQIHIRNLKICIFALKYIMLNCKGKIKLEFFNEIKNDQFFITSYQNGNKNNLNIIERTLAYMLKKDHIYMLLLISDIQRIMVKARNLLKIRQASL